ncbi:MAG: KEOPS complex subunit Pcc1 [Thermoplasmata archaeon]
MSLRRRYSSAAEARRLAAALEADQPAHVTWHVRGRDLEFTFSGPTPESARATGDDLLACLSAAERTAQIIPKQRTDLGRRPSTDR